jgi:hypothetical protein
MKAYITFFLVVLGLSMMSTLAEIDLYLFEDGGDLDKFLISIAIFLFASLQALLWYPVYREDIRKAIDDLKIEE